MIKKGKGEEKEKYMIKKGQKKREKEDSPLLDLRYH